MVDNWMAGSRGWKWLGAGPVARSAS